MSDGGTEAKDLKYRVETLLRNKVKLEELRDKKSRDKLLSKKLHKEKVSRKKLIKTPEELIRNYRNNRRNYKDYKFRKNKAQKVEIGEKVVFAIRISSKATLSKPQNSVFRKLGLLKVHEGAFFVNSENLQESLRKVLNHVIFGPLKDEVARELILKRSFIKTSEQVVPVTTNKLVEDLIGNGLVSLNDLVFELSMGGSNFDRIKEKLRPYKLTKPTHGYGDKNKPFKAGGSWGYYSDKFSDIVSKMI